MESPVKVSGAPREEGQQPYPIAAAHVNAAARVRRCERDVLAHARRVRDPHYIDFIGLDALSGGRS